MLLVDCVEELVLIDDCCCVEGAVVVVDCVCGVLGPKIKLGLGVKVREFCWGKAWGRVRCGELLLERFLGVRSGFVVVKKDIGVLANYIWR